MKKIKELKNQAGRTARRFKKRDFSGNAGKAIRNSTWQIGITLVSKIGSIAFIIIIARLMAPELYGLYGLALSTILLIGVFSDFGIGTALITFISKTRDKSPAKAKGYYSYLTICRIALVVFSSIILLALAGWLANTYYQKPIYYALLAGAIYLPIATFSGHLGSIFISGNNFRPQFIKEIIIQVSRLVVIPILIIYFLAETTSIESYLWWVIIALSFCYGLGWAYQWRASRKDLVIKTKIKSLSKKDKKRVLRFIIPLSITAFSGVFFGYIDQIMLGHYVESQFIGFYQAAFNLITSASAIISFSAVAVFPIFARLKSKQLERGFKRTRNITLLVSVLAAAFTFLLAPILIKIIYGAPYSTAINYLRILSLLLISFPLINLHITYYTSQERTKIISILLILSTILNIVLNYVFINIGLSHSMFHAVMGACVATIISRYTYLTGLIISKRLNFPSTSNTSPSPLSEHNS